MKYQIVSDGDSRKYLIPSSKLENWNRDRHEETYAEFGIEPDYVKYLEAETIEFEAPHIDGVEYHYDQTLVSNKWQSFQNASLDHHPV